MLDKALYIISKPSLNSNLCYSPETLNTGQNGRFFVSSYLEIWRMTFKNNRTPFVNSKWTYGQETVKQGFDLCDLDLWPLTLEV